MKYFIGTENSYNHISRGTVLVAVYEIVGGHRLEYLDIGTYQTETWRGSRGEAFKMIIKNTGLKKGEFQVQMI